MIAINVPRKRIYVGKKLDAQGGTEVWHYIHKFIMESEMLWINYDMQIPIRVRIQAQEIEPGFWTKLYFESTHGWKVQSRWCLE